MGRPSIAEAARLLNVRGEVLFVSQEPTTLSAKLADGTVIKSEHELDEPISKKRSPIAKLMLSKATANPRTIDAITRADVIVLGPGDLYTSTFPNLLVPGVAEAIRNSKAKKVLVTNIMTKLGQTDGLGDKIIELLEMFCKKIVISCALRCEVPQYVSPKRNCERHNSY